MNYIENKRFYDVSGVTNEEITNCLNTLGPVRAGIRYRAYTSWYFGYLIRYTFKNNLVYINTFWSKVNLTVSFDLPRWVGTSDTPLELRNKITTYIKNITTHEQGHADIAKQYAKKIEESFKLISPRDNLNSIAFDLKTKISELLTEHLVKQRAYDSETEHGHTQGAQWQ